MDSEEKIGRNDKTNSGSNQQMLMGGEKEQTVRKKVILSGLTCEGRLYQNVTNDA